MTRKILFSSSLIILKVVALCCLVLAAVVVYARISGYELLSVQSNSMQPVMHSGDAVLLSTRDTDPRIGDIVSFAAPENPRLVITHRVIGVDMRRGIVSTKGDNTAVVDMPAPAWNIQGTVQRVIPGMGYILNLLRSPLGLLAVVYVPTLGIIIAEIRRLSAYYTFGVTPGKRVHYALYGRKSARVL